MLVSVEDEAGVEVVVGCDCEDELLPLIVPTLARSAMPSVRIPPVSSGTLLNESHGMTR